MFVMIAVMKDLENDGSHRPGKYWNLAIFIGNFASPLSSLSCKPR